MDQYQVLFVGLISHIGETAEGGKKHAALIYDSDHFPAVDVIGMPSRVLVRDDIVSFNIGDGVAVADLAFETFVPHLQLLTDRAIRPEVLNGMSTNAVVAYVKYPAGSTLSVEEFYPLQATFTLGNTTTPERCVARVTALTIYSNSQVTLEIANGNNTVEAYPLSKNIPAIISNASTGADHFHEYLKLTNGSNIADVTETNECPIPKKGPRPRTVTTQVECTNSQWP